MSSDGYSEISKVDSTTYVGLDGEEVVDEVASRIKELWRGLACALELSRSRAKIVDLEAKLETALKYTDLIKTGAPTSGLMLLLRAGHPFVLESVCSPGMFCTMGSFGEVTIWNDSKPATKFRVNPEEETRFNIFSMEPASGELLSCIDGHPIKCAFGCMTSNLANGIRVRAMELPCTHAWQISHHLSQDGNVCFSFELTFLSSDVTKLPGSGFFLNVSGGRDENGTKVHVWKANLKCPDSQWRIHLV